MATRALIHIPAQAKRGEVVEIRATLGHAMETGHRPDNEGKLVPRDIVTRFECSLDGVQVFAADLYPAISANPYVAFSLRADKAGTLVFTWQGDHGFRHSETVPFAVT